VATTLAVYKPRGMTPYGRRKQDEGRSSPQPILPRRLTSSRNMGDTHGDDTRLGPGRGATTGPWGLYVLLVIIGLVLLFVVLHLAGGGLGGHSRLSR
jgi:hypothetical protein